MDKTFDPSAIEARVAARWESSGAFRAGRAERREAEPYAIVIPPPNVTGSLHMGHALNNTLQDILCRFERMRGKDVLWQPGTDHAGIATQMVVERQLAEKGVQRRDLGREEFVKRVWAWKEQSGGAIVTQLKRLGASCDWSRERFTMDEGLSKAVLKVFVDLHREGLIYKDKRLVNWDPKFQTAISDLEVQQIEKRGSFAWSSDSGEPFDAAALDRVLARDPNGHLYFIRYPVDGEPDRFITVATTRPETMLGDTGVAVHPDDERYRDLVGTNVILPLVGRPIPIVADAYSDPEKGTGAVKITPAHDFNDFEVGRRHGLELVNIFDPQANVTLVDNPGFSKVPRSQEFSGGVTKALHGKDRFEARRVIVQMLQDKGLLEAVEPHTHAVPHGDRSGAVIEPYLTDQWYLDVKPLAERALTAVKQGRTRIVPENWEKVYFQWLEKIEPWCISRQLWWGHQIPAWYGESKDEGPFTIGAISPAFGATGGREFVALSEVEAINSAKEYYGKNVGVVPTRAHAVAARINDSSKEYIWRDPDVLDTWFSSGLWPFSTFGWPEKTPELARYYPTSALVTGFDIIFFWVARMMMLGLHFMDEVPFREVYIHALVRDERGAKMSKSKGNVIDPLELIDRFGADALRFALTAQAAQGRDVKLSLQRVEGYRNFATKIWNAARFAEINGCVRADGFDPSAARETLNRWALGECASAVAEVTGAIQDYKFNEAAAAAYRFVWNLFCDWYVELSKPVLQGEPGPAQDETRATTAYLLDQVCKLLHPFMPFLTEELWAVRGGADVMEPGEAILALAPWPDLGRVGDPAAEAEIGWLIDLVSEIRSARSETSVPGGAQIPLVLVSPSPETQERVTRWEETIKRLARISDIATAGAAPRSSVQIIARGQVAALPLEGVVDLAAETARLEKEAQKLTGEIAKTDAKLGNADFLARAPEEVVDEQRERRDEAVARRAKITEALGRLGAAV